MAMRNHNHLLGSVEGVDGIKTGYTQESGFNLVTSVHRDGHYIIGVVLGGRSAFERDANMRELINGHIRQASLWRTAPLIVENIEASEPSVADTRTSVDSGADRLLAPSASDPIQPVLVKTIRFGTASAQAQSRTLGRVRVTVPTITPPRVATPSATGSIQHVCCVGGRESRNRSNQSGSFKAQINQGATC